MREPRVILAPGGRSSGASQRPHGPHRSRTSRAALTAWARSRNHSMQLTRPTEQLIAGLKAREPAAFDELHRTLGPSMYSFAVGLLRSPEDALDLVQEAYIVALTSIDRFREESSLKTWMFGILVNKARERRRKLGRELPESSLPDEVAARLDSRGHWNEPPQSWDDPSGTLDRQALARVAVEEMRALGETQQAVLRLRDVEGFDTAEVADMLAITEINVRVTLHRARTTLRQRIETRLAGDPEGAKAREVPKKDSDRKIGRVARFVGQLGQLRWLGWPLGGFAGGRGGHPC